MNLTAYVSHDSPTLDPAQRILSTLAGFGIRLTVRPMLGVADNNGHLTRRGYIAAARFCGRHLSTPVCEDASESVEIWWQMHGHTVAAVAA